MVVVIIFNSSWNHLSIFCLSSWTKWTHNRYYSCYDTLPGIAPLVTQTQNAVIFWNTWDCCSCSRMAVTKALCSHYLCSCLSVSARRSSQALRPCMYVPGQHSTSQMAGGNLSKASTVTEGCCVWVPFVSFPFPQHSKGKMNGDKKEWKRVDSPK